VFKIAYGDTMNILCNKIVYVFSTFRSQADNYSSRLGYNMGVVTAAACIPIQQGCVLVLCCNTQTPDYKILHKYNGKHLCTLKKLTGCNRSYKQFAAEVYTFMVYMLVVLFIFNGCINQYKIV